MSSQKIPGWGLVTEYRATPKGVEALVLFPEHEAPHWMPYPELATIRRELLMEKRSQP